MYYIAFISHSLHWPSIWHSIAIALFEYVIKSPQTVIHDPYIPELYDFAASLFDEFFI